MSVPLQVFKFKYILITAPKIVGEFSTPNLMGFLSRPSYNRLWSKVLTTHFGTVTVLVYGFAALSASLPISAIAID